MSIKKPKRSIAEDFVFLVKAGLYLLLGTVWIGFGGHRLIPIGLVLGFGLSQLDFLRIDRKIEYALLVVGALFGLYGLGITIRL